MQFSTTFLVALVKGAVVMAAAGVGLLAALFLADKKGGRLW